MSARQEPKRQGIGRTRALIISSPRTPALLDVVDSILLRDSRNQAQTLRRKKRAGSLACAGRRALQTPDSLTPAADSGDSSSAHALTVGMR